MQVPLIIFIIIVRAVSHLQEGSQHSIIIVPSILRNTTHLLLTIQRAHLSHPLRILQFQLIDVDRLLFNFTEILRLVGHIGLALIHHHGLLLLHLVHAAGSAHVVGLNVLLDHLLVGARRVQELVVRLNHLLLNVWLSLTQFFDGLDF